MIRNIYTIIVISMQHSQYVLYYYFHNSLEVVAQTSLNNILTLF